MPLVAVGIPIARARKVPMTAATMPTTIVSQIGMFCRPGRMSRARAPMMAPMTMAVMIPVTVMCFSIHVVVGGRLPACDERSALVMRRSRQHECGVASRESHPTG